MTKEKMMDFVKQSYPNAVFTWQDGTEIFWYHGRYGTELQFYPSERARDSDYACEGLYSCYVKNGNINITNDF